MTNLIVAKIGKDPTVNFALSELCRYLKKMDRRLLVDQRSFDSYDPEAKNTLWVGLTPLVGANDLDDEILIDVKNGVGVISGANTRAVLIAVYRFLRELGCRWVFPGEDGECIPKKAFELADLTASVREMPSVRYRGIVIEGASHFEHISDMIDWLPKASMNCYYFQFYSCDAFVEGWYKHRSNPLLEPEPYSLDESLGNKERVFEEIERRNIIVAGPGHGFTMFPFGIFDRNPDPESPLVTDELKSYLAEINGKREVLGGRLNFTQLCYSSPKLREMMTDYAVKYCKDHPSVKLLRFSLADGMNNHCECEECRRMRPSDWFLMILNEFDEKLTAQGIDVKVGFSAYVDTLFPPEHIKLRNPDRFIFNLSPSSRNYAKPLYEFNYDPDTYEIPPYERNKCEIPSDVEGIIAHYRRWREWLGDNVKATIFDYALMYEHFLDPGYRYCAEVLHKDATGLEKLDFIGYFSCQEQRCAFPTGLPNYALAAGLWDKNSKFEDVSREYYAAAFGEYGADVEAYLSNLTDMFDHEFMRNKKREAHATAAMRMDAIDRYVEEFKASHILPNRDVNASWNYLYHHVEYCHRYANLIRVYETCGDTEVEAELARFTEYHFSMEPELHRVFDNMYFEFVYRHRMKVLFKNLKKTVDFV